GGLSGAPGGAPRGPRGARRPAVSRIPGGGGERQEHSTPPPRRIGLARLPTHPLWHSPPGPRPRPAGGARGDQRTPGRKPCPEIHRSLKRKRGRTFPRLRFGLRRLGPSAQRPRRMTVSWLADRSLLGLSLLPL